MYSAAVGIETAVCRILNSLRTETSLEKAIKYPFSLCQRPPGKGKLYLILDLVQYWLESDITNKILVCAPSNNAVKDLYHKMRQKMEEKQAILYLNIKKQEEYAKKEEITECFPINAKDARVIFNTASSSIKFQMYNFSQITLDEAGQCIEPEGLLPLLHTSNNVVWLEIINSYHPFFLKGVQMI